MVEVFLALPHTFFSNLYFFFCVTVCWEYLWGIFLGCGSPESRERAQKICTAKRAPNQAGVVMESESLLD